MKNPVLDVATDAARAAGALGMFATGAVNAAAMFDTLVDEQSLLERPTTSPAERARRRARNKAGRRSRRVNRRR